MTQVYPDNFPVAWRLSEEERLRIACRAGSVGVWQWDLLTNDMRYTATAREICGFPEAGPISFEMVRAVVHPDDVVRTVALSKRALDPVLRDTTEYVYRILRADTGALRWVKAYGEAQFAIIDGVERAIFYVGSIQDITEEKHREEALAESEARLRLALDAGQLAVWEVDVNSDTLIGSPELNRLYGFPEDSTPTLDEFRSRYAAGERERVTKEAEQLLAAGETNLTFEIRHVWPDGTEKWLLLRAQAGSNRAGDGLRVIGVVADVTDAKTQEQRLETVARELRHRLLNTISVISALAVRSWPAGFSDARNDFQTRLRAIGKATDLMFLRDQETETATLKHLLYEITAPYRTPTHDPFTFDGPEVDVGAHLRPLAMAFHELCTNALKYGALSVPEGRVAVHWQVQSDGSLQIDWQEKDGPAVKVPEKSGLGSVLLTKLLFSSPSAVSVEYVCDGVRCSIVLHD